MKKLVLLLGAFALIGCGEKKSTDSAEGSQKAGPVQEAKEEVEVASSGPEPLISDADVERFAKDAMDSDGGSPPDDFTGWSKLVDQGQLVELMQWKNGEPDGPAMLWYETGEIRDMSIFKEGEMVSRRTYYPTGEKKVTMRPADAGSQEVVGWHKNGQKALTILMKDGAPLMKDGAPVMMRAWYEEGEELDQEDQEELKMMEQIFERIFE